MNNTQSDIFDKYIHKICEKYDSFESTLTKFVSTKRRVVIWMLVILSVFGILFLLNVFTPMIADDFGYLYFFGEMETGVKVTSISDIIRSQTAHYYYWGGRSVVHFIAQALLLLPPVVIDLLNTSVYMLYVTLIYLLIRGRRANSLWLFILINIGVWFIQPAYCDTILWVTGSANYLWGTTFILLFLLPYRMYQGGKGNPLYAILFFVYSIIAGWTNENTAGAMLLMSIFFLFHYRSHQWKIPLWATAGLIGALIGYIIMILAPGNANRAGDAATINIFIICYRLFMHTLTLVTEYGAYLLFYLAIFLLYRHFAKEKSEEIRISITFLIGTLAGIYAMILSPSFPPRAWFGVLTYLLIAIGIILYNLNYEKKILRQLRLSVCIVGGIAFLFSLYVAGKDLYRFQRIFNEREALIMETIARGDKQCEFERYVAETKFTHSEDYTANYLFAPYYGVDVTYSSRR